MTIGSFVRARPVPILYGLMIASLVALLPLPPLLQDQAYHQFADQRELFGIPNFWNVVSNLPFVAVGAVGLLRFHREALVLDPSTGRLTDADALGTMHWQCGHQLASELLDLLQPRYERDGDLTKALHVAKLRVTLPFDDMTEAEQRLRRVTARLN